MFVMTFEWGRTLFVMHELILWRIVEDEPNELDEPNENQRKKTEKQIQYAECGLSNLWQDDAT